MIAPRPTGERIVVVGAGAFGTALACVVARHGDAPVTLLARDAAKASQIAATRCNAAYLPGVILPDTIAVTHAPEIIADATIVLLAVPAQAQGLAARQLSCHLGASTAVVICAKGMERESDRFLSAVVADSVARDRIAVLSGPGFAADIAKGLPTAMTLAAHDMAMADRLAVALWGPTFRLYASDDVTGVEIGGALKNVLAIASGIVEGAGLGESARAALIARGLSEMARFAVAHGGHAATLSGLSGLGDLVLTATSRQSRNMRFGLALGEGQNSAALAGAGQPLCEGALTAPVAVRLAQARGIDMPIAGAVADIIGGRMSIEAAMSALMARPLRDEAETSVATARRET
jgi:glycerol-3-phosphate dehydrogenase (NAD(P)+)